MQNTNRNTLLHRVFNFFRSAQGDDISQPLLCDLALMYDIVEKNKQSGIKLNDLRVQFLDAVNERFNRDFGNDPVREYSHSNELFISKRIYMNDAGLIYPNN